MLLPGTYQIRATHTNKFGVIESELTDIYVTENVDMEAQIVDLTCRLRLEDSFLVTGVKKGFCRFLDNNDVKEEVRLLFRDCRVTLIQIVDEECKRVPDDPVNFQVAFIVKIVMDHSPMLTFFTERWDEVEVRRPQSEFEAGKLRRRAAMYSTETWCGRQGEDWVVRRYLSDK